MSDKARVLTIPIDEWIKLMESGVNAPAMVKPVGRSMWPLIRSGQDTIEVRPVTDKLRPGDVVVFRRSEGQAQRVSIARAVLSGKPVILLDEATSALDADTERRVLSNIKAIPDITCIAVTHRPAAVEMSDTVIAL